MERLKKLRKERHISQQEVAHCLGITVSAYGNYELGQRNPSYEILCKMADYFNVTVDYLLGHDNSPTSKIQIPDEYKDLPIAFYEGAKGLTQEDIDAVIKFMEFLKIQNKSK